MKRNLFLTTSLVALSLFSVSEAFAQDSAPQGPAETVEVTGTRISRPGYTAPTPLTAISAQDLIQVNPGNMIDALRELPILSASTGPRGATGSAGSGGEFLNLRGLGGNNTLVLLDGNRFVPTTSDSTVDVSMFPTALIARTDIVTGGASAAYGSDAVTGVVNFVLNRDYTGFKASAQGGISTFGDDQETKLTAAAGSSFGNDHGHILVSGEFFDSKGIYSLIDRPLGQKSCNAISNPVTTPATPGATLRVYTCGVRNSQANFTGVVTNGAFQTKGVNGLPLTALTFDNNGNPTVFHYGTLASGTTMVGGDGIIPSFLPGEVPLRRNVYYGRVSWDFGIFSSYLELNAGTSNNDYQIGSYDQNLGSTTGIVMQSDNAYLPASVKTAMATNKLNSITVSKYFADLPRTWIENRNTTSRAVVGFNGKIADWTWDAHFEHGTNWQSVNALWDEDLNHMALATDAVVNTANGEIVCRTSLTNPTSPCVPYNPLGNAGLAAPVDGQGFNGASNAQLNYITGTDWQHTRIMEDDVAFNVNGEPFSLWAGPVSFAAGGEWRGEGLRQSSDPYGANTPNALSGANGPFRVGNYQVGNGSFTAIEGYIETVVPLLRGIPFAQSVDFSGAMRETSYSNAGTSFTWKAGLTWDVTDELRLRGTFSQDARAPNLTELYSGVVSGHASIIDFTHAGNPVSPQALTLQSGNPNLTTQAGETTTFGVVYQPGWLSGLQASVDFYHIGISNAIQALGAQAIVQQCALGVTQLCPLIGFSNGVLTSVNVSPANIQSLSTTGVDFESSYNLQLADITDAVGGDVTFHALANYVSTFYTRSPGAVVINTAGQDSRPQWRWTTQVSYHNGPWKLFVQARYSGDGWVDKSTLPTDLVQLKVPGQIPVDANISYDIPTGTGTTQLFLNITDVFNDQPPPFSSVGNYDAIGRFYRAGVRISL